MHRWWGLLTVGSALLAATVAAQPGGGLSRIDMRPGGAACPEDQLELIDIDTLFYVANRGLSRIFVELNGHAFKLVTDTTEWRQSGNAFPIPQFGEITVSIGAYIVGGDNCMTVKSQGPSGSDADLVIGDLLVPGQHIAYAIQGLAPLPEAFSPLRSTPNPFRTETALTYEIPADRTNGLPVSIDVYDVAGRRVRTLADTRHFPGRFTVRWDGTGSAGQRLAAGVYFCQIVAGPYAATLSVVLVE